MKGMTRAGKKKRTASTLKKMWNNKLFYLLALPGVIFLAMFNYAPMAGL